MRLLPGSLLWRTLLVLLAALVLSQAAALWLFDEYVTRPRTAVGMRQFVSHLKTVSAALETMDPSQHPAFIAPSIDLSVAFHRSKPDEPWLFAQASAPSASGGLIGCESRVWARDGTLLAVGASQLLCRPGQPF